MTQISSNYLFIVKWVLPLLWFGLLAYIAVETILNGNYEKQPLILVFLCLGGIITVYYLKKDVWDLVDEVYDYGDSLLVKKGGKEDRVAISDIVSVNFTITASTNIARITLRLMKAGKFGTEITFSPTAPFTLVPSTKNQVAEDLIVRCTSSKGFKTNF